MTRPRILLADDHRMVAEGLKALLGDEFDLVGVVEDGGAMLEAAARLEPDAIVADIAMPNLNGIEALERLRETHPQIRVVFLTMHRNATYARRALDAGASGFVVKHAAPDELVLALRMALDGKTYVTPSLTQDMRKKEGKPPSDEGGSLTLRQKQILQLLAEGRSAKEIASDLGISPRTVEFHKYGVMEAHGIRTSAELVQFAIKHGIASI